MLTVFAQPRKCLIRDTIIPLDYKNLILAIKPVHVIRCLIIHLR